MTDTKEEVIYLADKARKNWEAYPMRPMAKQIALTALQTGEYAIWQGKFDDCPTVLEELENIRHEFKSRMAKE